MMPSINYLKLILIFIFISIFSACSTEQTIEISPPPVTNVSTVIDTLHGLAIADDYRWLEDQQSDETRAWIETQNQYTRSILNQIPINEKVKNRLTELIKIDKITTPSQRGDRYFLYKRNADQELYVIYKREGLNGEDEVLLDPHPMSDDYTVTVGMLDISVDGKVLVYSVRKGGEDQHEIRLFDVDAKKDLPDILPRANYFGSVSITSDNKALYYNIHDSEIGPRVYYHKIGDDPSEDKIIFGENYGPKMFIVSNISESGNYLLLSVYAGSATKKTDIYYKNLVKNSKIKLLVNDVEARFFGSIVDNFIYLQTDWKAPNGKIIKVDLNKPAKKYWEDIVPESKLVMEYFSLAGGKLFINYLDSIKSKLSIFDSDGKYLYDISIPNIGTVSGLNGNWDSDLAFYSFSSFNTPASIYKYDIGTGNSEVWEKPNINLNSDDIEIKQVWFESKDGTKVPMFVVHQKDLKLNGQNPTLMHGYGGFGASLTPYFSSTTLTWIENGGVYAEVNLRGGGEFGETWHEDGMLENKQNTFDDFIAAAEWLIKNKYTSSEHLAIRGGSNGGLLVGACLTQRPDLFGAVICSYPLLDMVRFHKFLIAKVWISEYGSSEDPEQFKYIYDYSPYHNVKKNTQYPATLFITGDADTRVDPNHARKMTALLQANNVSKNPIMIRYEIKAGHSGGKPISKIIDDIAEELNFLFWQLN